MDCAPKSKKKRGADMWEFAVPDWCEITLTHRCNQRCFFCYEEGRDIACEPGIEEVKSLLKKSAERAELIVLCGKEVLLRRDILEIVSFATSIGLKVAIFSNGQPLSKNGFVEELANAGCSSIAISFHFPDESTFAIGARVKPEGFRRIIKGIENLRDYNLAHPDRPLKVSTETDMFVLNMGRLADIRKTLIEAFGESPWNMRIGTLLPTKIYDIGFDHILEPIEERRRELADFILTHPPNLPLAFVKTPLCLLPQGEEHRTLEAKYLYEGTVLTFNHVEADMITSDTISVSAYRDLKKNICSHPYRWICRRCSLVAMCRYDRVDWFHRHFEPTKEQKPKPYSTVTISDILSRFGENRKVSKQMEDTVSALKKIKFPEEEIMEAFSWRKPGMPEFIDAWIDRKPLFVADFRYKGFRVPLWIGMPAKGEKGGSAGAIIDYLIVESLADRDVPADIINDCLHAVAGVTLPQMERFSDLEWFDALTAEMIQSAWRIFGKRLWAGFLFIKSWKTKKVIITKPDSLCIELCHASLATAELTFEKGKGNATVLILGLKAGGGNLRLSEFMELVYFISNAMSVSRPRFHITESLFTEIRAGNSVLILRKNSWLIQRLKPGEVVLQSGNLTFSVIDRKAKNVENVFHIALYKEGKPFFRRAGKYALWYSHHPAMEKSGIFGAILIEAMKRLKHFEPSEENLEIWRKEISKLLESAGLSERFDWSVKWSGNG